MHIKILQHATFIPFKEQTREEKGSTRKDNPNCKETGKGRNKQGKTHEKIKCTIVLHFQSQAAGSAKASEDEDSVDEEDLQQQLEALEAEEARKTKVENVYTEGRTAIFLIFPFPSEARKVHPRRVQRRTKKAKRAR